MRNDKLDYLAQWHKPEDVPSKRMVMWVGAGFSALLALAGLLLVIAFFGAGCVSGDGVGPTTLAQCQKAQKVVDLYDALLASGSHVPTPQETQYASAARALLALYCGGKGTVVAVSEEGAADGAKALPTPRQPKKFKADGLWWYRVQPYSILFPDGMETMSKSISIGPWYRPAWSKDVYMPDLAWLMRQSESPTMIRIGD
jgi:hypothetical protein